MIARGLMLAALLLLAAASFGGETNTEMLKSLPQVRFPAENRIVSGAIGASDVEALRAAGIKHVINLRPAEENPQFDEARALAEHGLIYHTIPIKGAESLTIENAQAFDRMLAEIGREPVLVHCSSGNRVGALVAVREAWIHHRSTDDAIAEGKRWGLTHLEGSVRTLLAH